MTIALKGHGLAKLTMGSDNGILHLKISMVRGLAIGIDGNDGAPCGLGGHKGHNLLLQLSMGDRAVGTEQRVVTVDAYLQHMAAADVTTLLLVFVERGQPTP